MAWYDDFYDSAMDAVGFGDDDDKKKSDAKTKAKSGEEKEEKSWFDKINWDDVSESVSDLFGGDDDKTSNAKTRQQPNQTVKDNHGNAVTGSAQPQSNKTMLYVGGGVAALVAVIGLVLVIKK